MKTIKKIAVYMDHFTANIIEYANDAKEVKTIKSEFNHLEKEKILQKGESHLHNKEQDMQNMFYKKLREELLNYDEVLLFGATNAKTELSNILKADNKFTNVEIIVKNTDKLSDKKQIAFVNDCFYIN
jgi:2-succinyl-5-enolpyruvyl-6-hydroxy-3-cyclohexene-1-carboxylate synthase